MEIHTLLAYVHDEIRLLSLAIGIYKSISVLMCVKEELAWATEKWPRVISNM